ncbi:reverse transcriptase domain-containing protein [Tanacetum coccineum]
MASLCSFIRLLGIVKRGTQRFPWLQRRTTINSGQDHEAKVLLAVNSPRCCKGTSRLREMARKTTVIRECSRSSAIIKPRSRWLFSHWGVNILGPLPTALGGFKFLVIAIEHSTKWVEAKPLTTLLRNSKKETPFSLTYSSEAIIPIPKNDVAKDDKGKIKEVDKRRGNKEIASIEEAYCQSMAGSSHDKGSSQRGTLQNCRCI